MGGAHQRGHVIDPAVHQNPVVTIEFGVGAGKQLVIASADHHNAGIRIALQHLSYRHLGLTESQ
jgi:hypothetical protein